MHVKYYDRPRKEFSYVELGQYVYARLGNAQANTVGLLHFALTSRNW